MPAPNSNVATSTTSPANNYSINLPFQKTTYRYDIKVDYQLTPKDHLSGRYNDQHVTVFQAPAFGAAGGGPAQGAFAGTGTQGTYSTGINYDRAFSGTLLTEARVGVAHYGNSATPTGYGTDYATQAGIPGVNISQFTSGQVGIFLATFSTNPLIGYSASLPWIRGETNIDIVNHWTKIIGNHTIKFGVDIRRIHDDLLQDQTFSPRGAITFSENNTSEPGASTNIANEMASFLLDVPSQVGRDINTYFPKYRQWWFFSFVGDKWQVSPKLTLDLGRPLGTLSPGNPGERRRVLQLRSNQQHPGHRRQGGNPSNLGMNNRFTYFAPRVGFAYRATEQTVIRGGFGISYTPFEDNTYAYNFPVRANNSYQQLNSYQPALLTPTGPPVTFQDGFPAPVPVPIPSTGIIPANTSQLLNQSYVYIPKDYHNPYVESWNVAVQQSLAQTVHDDGRLRRQSRRAYRRRAEYQPGAGAWARRGRLSGKYRFQAHRGDQPVFPGLFLQLSISAAPAKPPIRRRIGCSHLIYLGKGLGYQTGDDGGLLFLARSGS